MKAAIDQPIKEFISNLPQIGTLEWIGIRPERKKPLKELKEVEVTKDGGLLGDHFAGKFSKKRQVTLIQKEHLDAVSSMMGMEMLDPGLLRRNLVISGINLFALKDQKFSIGEVIFEGTGYCHPCTRMEENLGPGGYNAMRGHGGITAHVIQGGTIHISDEVKLIVE